MVDMGGGSTELVHFCNGLEPLIISLPFGCLSLFNNFVKDNVPTTDEEKKIKEFVIKHLEKCAFVKSKRIPMYFIGGSGRAIQKVLLSELNKKNISVDGNDFDFVVEKYRDKLFFENAENITPGRSNTVAPAAIAYKCIVNFIEPSSIIVSESGVREGYLEKILP